MSDQSWLNSSGNVVAGDAPILQPYELSPLNTGEVLDRTFQMFRKRFWLFAGLAAMPSGITAVLDTVYQINSFSFNPAFGGAKPSADTMLHVIFFLIYAMFYVLAVLIMFSLLNAATTWAISRAYLGEEATISSALSSLKGKWLRYILLAIMQGLYASWSIIVAGILFSLSLISAVLRPGVGTGVFVGLAVLLMIGSMFFSLWSYLRVSISLPASVVENLGVFASLRRSKQLLVTRKVRIFLLLLFVLALTLVLGAISSFILIPMMIPFLKEAASGSHPNPQHLMGTVIVSEITNFISRTIISPIGVIGLCLFYLDERVRREGFDIEFLMDKAQLPVAQVLKDTTAQEA